jgi:plasmid stability protein
MDEADTMSGMTSIQKFRWLMLAIGALLAIAGGGWLLSQSWLERPVGDPKLPLIDPRLPTTPVARPAPSPEGYVGSAACAKCHEDICKTFAQHPMGRSSALTPGEADLEDFSAEKATFSAADGTRYHAEKVGDQVLHHEMGTDPQGRVLYDRKVSVSLAIGSGTRGITYGTNHSGILLQSPISWYSAKGGYFELSPGYENVASSPRFSRRMVEACLVCHVGRMEFDPEVPDKLLPPYFHEIAIGCERCHGPGERHVAAQQAGKTSSPDPTIVNPARLPVRERESVCNQCHLHGDYRGVRYGRRPRDFRPGMPLDEVFCILVKEDSVSGESKAVSQVEQMRASACFRGNPEKLGCISCHNPHEWPVPEQRDEYYRSRCNQCHADKGCSLAAEQRKEKADSCVACHMPRFSAKDIVHASQTDHRVPKNPLADVQGPRSGGSSSLQTYEFFDESDKRLPDWEVQRARGMQMANDKTSDSPQKALSLLLPLTAVAPDDIPLLLALGAAYYQRADHAEARKWLERVVALEPKNEQGQILLALACVGLRDLAAAKKHISEVVRLNPHVAKNFQLQAKILAQRGEFEQALEAAEKQMELDPTQSDLRDHLLRELRK